MPTKITLGLDSLGKDGPTQIVVQEDFDTCIERFWPTSQPSSALEARTNNVFTTLDDKRILIKTPSIIMIEEDWED